MPRPWPYTPTWTIPWGGGVAGRRTGPYIGIPLLNSFQVIGRFLTFLSSGRRNIPGGGDSQVDELIWGSDVDSSSDPALLAAKAQLFEGRAGTLRSKTEGRTSSPTLQMTTS